MLTLLFIGLALCFATPWLVSWRDKRRAVELAWRQNMIEHLKTLEN